VPAEGAAGRLSHSSRIKKRLEFEAAQNGGRRATTAHFVFLLYARSEAAAPARLGIVASRKIGNAVVRNRAKRLVREAFRTERGLFEPGIDVVVIVRRPLSNLKLGDVVAEWKRAGGSVASRTADARRDEAVRRSEASSAGARG